MLESKAIWNFNQLNADVDAFAGDTRQLSPIMKELLIQRGIATNSEAEAFLSPSLDDLLDPSGFSSIDIAAERIHKAIQHGEKILIYGDYDAGATRS